VGPVETLGIHAIEMSHGPGKATGGGMEQEVIMIFHETICMNFHIPNVMDILQKVEECEPILLREKDLTTSRPTMEDMVPCPRVFDP
jgi:hypothetical protein